MSHPAERSVRGRLTRHPVLAVVGLAFASGCFGGSSQTPANYPQPSADADNQRTRAINQRIAEAARQDSVAGGEADFASYRIGADDLLDVGVFGADAFSGQFRVGDTGQIAVPLLGAIEAAGRTPRELESHLETRLAETYMRDPHVTVQVAEMQSHGVSVVGAVNQPGVYQVSGRATLLEVLAMAEGLTAEAGSQVYVVRPTSSGSGGGTVIDADLLPPGVEAGPQPDLIEVDLGALLESGRTEENIVLRAGDIVQVRPAGIVYVVGQVNQPGGFPTPAGSPMTVLQALALARGLGNTAAPDRAVIVREGPQDERIEIPVNLAAVLEGSDPPPQLVARDVLFVPNNGVKSFGLGVINALVSMVTFRGLVY